MEGARFDCTPHLERILSGLVEYCCFSRQRGNANHDQDRVTSAHALLKWHIASPAGTQRLRGRPLYSLLFIALFSSFLTDKQDEYDSQGSYAADALEALAGEKLRGFSNEEREEFSDFAAEYVQYYLEERERANAPHQQSLPSEKSRNASVIGISVK
jgi:hypothetical protein